MVMCQLKMTDFTSIPNILSHVTVRLACTLPDGKSSVGTGFHFKFEGLSESIIVTNRHVVEDAVSAEIQFTPADQQDGPDLGNHFTATFPDFTTIWQSHPDPSVDLVAIPISRLKVGLNAAGRSLLEVYLSFVGDSVIPSMDRLRAMRVIEDIVMVGYPIGLWDTHNNLPIFRSGTTATSPGLNYDGRKEFVIDAACFPGSSGSPVFRYVPELSIKAGAGVSVSGGDARLELLGVLYAGPQFNAQGTIDIVTVPTRAVPISNTSVPMNLGYVIRSEQLHAFRRLCGGT